MSDIESILGVSYEMGDELVQPIGNFKGIYHRAKKEGLRLKAHVGEWGTAGDVRIAVEELDDIRCSGLETR